MYDLIISDSYLKKAKKFFARRPELLSKYAKVLSLLRLDPGNPALKLHKLNGNLGHCYAVSVSLSYRLVIYFVFVKNSIVLVEIGSHEQVY